VNGLDGFRAPEGGEPSVHEFVAEVDGLLLDGEVFSNGKRTEEDDGFSFLFVGDADDGGFTLSGFIESEGGIDGGFDDFVRDHFATNF